MPVSSSLVHLNSLCVLESSSEHQEKNYSEDREKHCCEQRDLLELLIQCSALRLLVEGIGSATANDTHTLIVALLGHDQNDQCDADYDINTCKYNC